MQEKPIMSEQEIQPIGQDNEASAETILAMRARPPIESHLIKGVGAVHIYGLLAIEKAQWQNECRDGKGQVNIEMVEPLMFQMCVRDSTGHHLFKRADVLKIKELPAAVVSRICDICMRLSGMGRATDETLLKNFAPTATEDS